MPKKIRLALIALAALLGIVLIAGTLVFANLNTIVRRSTEAVLTHVLGVMVKVDSAEVKSSEGSISLRGILIPNPPGYKTARAMYFSEVYVKADLASLRTDEPTINLIRIVAPDITWEHTMKSSNLTDLQKNAERLASEDTPTKDDPEGTDTALRIDRIEIQRPKVGLALPGSSSTASLTTPDIIMNDIGGKGERVTPAEAMDEVLTAILTSVTAVAGDALGSAKKVAEEAGEAIGEGAKKVGGELEKVGDKIGGIFKKKSDDAAE